MRNKFFTLFLGLVVMVFAANAQDLFKASNALKQKAPVKNQTHQIYQPTSKAVIFSEDFEGGAIPEGWTTIDGDCGWEVGTDGSSSYFPIPAHTTYAYANDDACNGDMSDVWLITPSIDLSSYSAPQLVFESFQYYDVFTVKVSTDGGSSFSDLEVIPSNGEAWESIAIGLSAYAGQADVQIAFHYNDAGAWGYGWAIDDVYVVEPEPHDLGIVSISPSFVLAGESAIPVVQVGNYGSNDEATYTVELTDGEGYSETISDDGTLEAGYMYDFEFPAWTPTTGEHTLTATVTVADDADTDNNTYSIDVVVQAAVAFAGNTSQGVYGIIDLATGTLNGSGTIGTDPFPMAEEKGGSFVYRIHSDFSFGTVAADGTYESLGTVSGASGTPTAIAYDWATNTMYMIVLNGSDLPDTYTLDLGTLEATLVGSGSMGMVIGADFANDGYIYAPTLDDVLVMIDPADGSVTEIGAIGFDANYGQDVSYDPIEGVLYSITCGDLYAFGTYDLTTGAFTQIADMGGDQYGTFVITKAGGDQYDVTFTVTDGTNAVEGATVTVAGMNAVTDASGVAVFALTDGEYAYTVVADGFGNATGNVTVDGADVAESVTMMPVFNVTFNVDMTNANAFDPETQLLWLSGGLAGDEGTIGNYDRWPQPGTYIDFKFDDADGDLIYTLELEGVYPGVYEYKYFWTDPGTPSWDNGFPADNASFEVIDGDLVIEEAVGISTAAEAIDFKLYPNPSNGIFNVTVDDVYEITVSNAIGQTIMTVIVDEAGTINLSDYAKGMYFVTAKSDEVTSTLRVIVE